MSRLAQLDKTTLTAEQRQLYDEIAGPRGGVVAGPFGVWLHAPRIADGANRFGNALRAAGKLEKRLFELMVLTIARHWSSQYEWHAHEAAARKAGLPDPVIEALRAGRAPAFEAADEALIYRVVQELQITKKLSPATYQSALDLLGLEVLIELVTAIGFYTTAAIVINSFEAPVPDGSRPLPDLA